MTDAINVALSGISAAIKRTDIAANNIANLSSENFKKKVPVQVENPGQGTSLFVQNENGVDLDNTTSEVTQPSNVKIEQEMVELMQAKNNLSANIKVIKATYENVGAILDIKG
jgi:flagellar hook-associated protein FlgK